MDKFESFFSEIELVKLLCKYRANAANKRHSKHMIRNVSLHKSSKKIAITDSHVDFKFLQDKFPTRRNWKKLNENERKIYKDSIKINQQRLYKSYLFAKREIKNGATPPNWYSNLITFIYEIQTVAFNIEHSSYKMSSPYIRGIKKEVDKTGVIIYRPIALYDIKDKIICSIAAKYFREYFEPAFARLNCSYAFRPRGVNDKVPDHHNCIEEIINYKKLNPKLWVTECDIQKFFDTVQHVHILKVLDNLIEATEKEFGLVLDSRVKRIFNLFLDSFSFQGNILNLDKDWFKSNKLPFGKFKWVEDDLNKEFGKTYTNDYRIGVPQGNAISCLIANIILHNVDEKIKDYDKDIFYIRYCDDMILMHSDESKCSEALEIFMKGINENYLLFHPAKKIVNYKHASIKEKFWKSKSKKPFFWDDPNINENNIPWVSFVGYQIDFHGRIRVRKSTLKKEAKKQISESQKIIKSLGKFHRENEIKEEDVRLAKTQIVFRTKQKLISMSVGRVTIHNHKKPDDQGLCWTNGFKKLRTNKISSKQLRYLDKRRHLQIGRINNELRKITKEVENDNFPDELKKIYFGCAFSYFNYLKHKTN